MTYIFLDVDGVLNNHDHYFKQHKKYGGRFFAENMPFNPRSLKNLKKIVDETDGQIVLTSSWRRDDKCMTVLKARLLEYGMRIFSSTDFISGRRGTEIHKWLTDNEKIFDMNKDAIIIIDDKLYNIRNIYSEDKIILCSHFEGLNWKKTREAIKKAKQQLKRKENGNVEYYTTR